MPNRGCEVLFCGCGLYRAFSLSCFIVIALFIVLLWTALLDFELGLLPCVLWIFAACPDLCLFLDYASVLPWILLFAGVWTLPGLTTLCFNKARIWIYHRLIESPLQLTRNFSRAHEKLFASSRTTVSGCVSSAILQRRKQEHACP